MNAFNWNWIGLACGGVLVGYFVALSQSPVVATVMPLLFGLIAGASGFVLGKTDVSQDQSLMKLKYWGVGFSAFSIAVLLSSMFSLWVTRGVIGGHVPSVAVGDLSAQEASRLVALRKKLQILGATDDEIERILSNETFRLSRPNDLTAQMHEYLGGFLPVLNSLYIELEPGSSKLSVTMTEELASMSALLTATVPILEEWEKTGGGAPPIRVTGVALVLESIESVVEENVGSASADSEKFIALGKDKELLSAFLQVKASLKYRHRAVSKNRSYGNDSYNDVDKLTELLISGQVTKEGISQYFAYQGSPVSRDGIF